MAHPCIRAMGEQRLLWQLSLPSVASNTSTPVHSTQRMATGIVENPQHASFPYSTCNLCVKPSKSSTVLPTTSQYSSCITPEALDVKARKTMLVQKIDYGGKDREIDPKYSYAVVEATGAAATIHCTPNSIDGGT